MPDAKELELRPLQSGLHGLFDVPPDIAVEKDNLALPIGPFLLFPCLFDAADLRTDSYYSFCLFSSISQRIGLSSVILNVNHPLRGMQIWASFGCECISKIHLFFSLLYIGVGTRSGQW